MSWFGRAGERGAFAPFLICLSDSFKLGELLFDMHPGPPLLYSEERLGVEAPLRSGPILLLLLRPKDAGELDGVNFLKIHQRGVPVCCLREGESTGDRVLERVPLGDLTRIFFAKGERTCGETMSGSSFCHEDFSAMSCVILF